MLHCLFAGLGTVGQRHLRNLRAVLGRGLKVSAFRVRGDQTVYDEKDNVTPVPPDTSAPGLCESHGIRRFDDLDEALAAKPDVCFVTNPTALHVPVALAAAEAGCDLFIEGPVSHSKEGVQELMAEVRERRVIAFVGCALRYHPAFRRVRAWLGQGHLGRVITVDVEVGEHLPTECGAGDYRQGFAARRDLGGGAVLTHARELDYLFGLLGAPRRVFATGGTLALDVDVEDVSCALLEFQHPDGRVMPVQVRQDFVQRPARRRCRILTERGTIEWDLSGGVLTLIRPDGVVEEQHRYGALIRNQIRLSELRDFFSCMAERRVPDVGIREACIGLDVALAIRASIETGRPQLVSNSDADPESGVMPTLRKAGKGVFSRQVS